MPDRTLVPRPVSPDMADFLAGDPGRVQIRPNRTWSVSLRSFASAGSWSMCEMTYTFERRVRKYATLPMRLPVSYSVSIHSSSTYSNVG